MASVATTIELLRTTAKGSTCAPELSAPPWTLEQKLLLVCLGLGVTALVELIVL